MASDTRGILPEGIDVLFIAGFGPIVTNQEASECLCRDMRLLPLEAIKGYEGYLHTAKVEGVKHFALCPWTRPRCPVVSAKANGRRNCPCRKAGWK